MEPHGSSTSTFLPNTYHLAVLFCLEDLTILMMLEQQKDGIEKELLLFCSRLRCYLCGWDCCQPSLREEEFKANRLLTLVDISNQYCYITGIICQFDSYLPSQFFIVTSWFIWLKGKRYAFFFFCTHEEYIPAYNTSLPRKCCHIQDV